MGLGTEVQDDYEVICILSEVGEPVTQMPPMDYFMCIEVCMTWKGALESLLEEEVAELKLDTRRAWPGKNE